MEIDNKVLEIERKYEEYKSESAKRIKEINNKYKQSKKTKQYQELYSVYSEMRKKIWNFRKELNNIQTDEENTKTKIKELETELVENYFKYSISYLTKLSDYNITVINRNIDYHAQKIKENEKDILNKMGIFLAIFSVIGFGASSVLTLESNHFAVCSMICGVILITMTSLFYLINFSYEDIWTSIGRMIIPICIGFGLIIFGANYTKSHPSENKTTKDLETRLKIVEEKIDYEKRINELENKAK